jgi:hypothetical protein
VNDLRYSARMLARSPGFAIVAVGLLCVGIGARYGRTFRAGDPPDTMSLCQEF